MNSDVANYYAAKLCDQLHCSYLIVQFSLFYFQMGTCTVYGIIVFNNAEVFEQLMDWLKENEGQKFASCFVRKR